MRKIFLILVSCLGLVRAEEAASEAPLNKIQQQEIVRKQEQVFRAQKSLKDAAAAEENGDLKKAQELYRSALQVLNKSEATAPAHATAVAGLVRVNLQLGKKLSEEGRFTDSIAQLDEALKWDPTNAALVQARESLLEAVKDPAKARLIYNSALTPGFKNDLATVQSAFVLAEQYRRTGQYDEAVVQLKKILAIDPYNKQAYSALEKITKEKNAYAEKALEQTRESRLTEVDGKWNEVVRKENLIEAQNVVSTPITRSTQFQINQKLRSLIIPQIEFSEGTTIEDAVNFLNSKSKEIDKDGKRGVTFVVKPEVVATAKPFSLSLKNVPLGEALRYISQLAGVKFKIEEFAVFVIRLLDPEQGLLRRQFNVSPDFFPTTSSAPSDESAASTRRLPSAVPVTNAGGNIEVKESLTSRGVEFPQGASAVYIPTSGVLSVINTQEQLDLIEELVNATSAQALMVDVQTKIVEINQEDLNELTFNLQFNAPNLTANPLLDPALTTPGLQTALRGSQGFTQSGLDSILRGSVTPRPHLFNVAGFLNQRFFAAVISALAQKRSTDLLSSPSLRVRSGERAQVKVTRAFIYPTSFDPPELISLNQNNAAGGTVVVTINPAAAIPAFPREFATTDIGVKLDIQPQITSDNRTIDLSLLPEITDFEGFINYGTPITITDRSGNINTLTDNTINTPVFNRRKVTTKVSVRDGYTVVLGGLVREDYQDINDKVPILGDLPLIGRAFQSKATKSTKKNLLIFASTRIMRPDGEPLNRLDDGAVASAK